MVLVAVLRGDVLEMFIKVATTRFGRGAGTEALLALVVAARAGKSRSGLQLGVVTEKLNVVTDGSRRKPGYRWSAGKRSAVPHF